MLISGIILARYIKFNPEGEIDLLGTEQKI